MIVHITQIHARDAWCAEFHLRTYLRFCDRAVVAVDGDEGFAGEVAAIDPRLDVFVVVGGDDGLPASRVNERGVCYHEGAIRQASLDRAMALHGPTLLVFGDADEVPTPDVVDWIRSAAIRPQAAERWYAHWVNLWTDYRHAIGGGSAWSFQNPRGNKKCLAMQPGGDMRYDGAQHTGMEPGRRSGGAAPAGPGRELVDSPKLLHLKYASEVYPMRPESKIDRHQPCEMLRGGHVVEVPEDWLWEGMPR